MKRKFYFPTVFLLLASLSLQAQNLTFSPEKPMPGEKVMLTYTPAGSPLEGIANLQFVAYLFEKDSPDAAEIEMAFDGNTYKGSLTTPPGTKAFAVAIHDGGDEPKYDNNGDMGYKKMCFQADRTTPVQGAYARKSAIVNNWGKNLGIKNDNAKAYELIKKEFEAFPESRNDEKLFGYYAQLAKNQKDEAAVSEVKNTIAQLSSKKKPSGDELWKAYQLSASIQEKGLSEELSARLKKAFPNGKIAKSELTDAFWKAKTPEEKVVVYEKFKKAYGNDEGASDMLDSWIGGIAEGFSDKKDFGNARKYLAIVKSKNRKAGTLNSIAWSLAGEGLEGEAGDLEIAKKMSAESLQLLEEEMANPTSKPTSYTANQWKKQLGRSYGMYADTYALALFRSGNAEEALKYQQISCDKNKFKDEDMNERYCVYLEKVKGSKEAEMMLEKLVTEGTANSKMQEQHKRLFLANNTLESAYDKYLVKLEEKALENLKEELKKKMLDKKAPGFRLVNLKGEEVSLEGLHGKVVVVDFWAVWCGPCKASFPGMQKAVNKFADNDDVEFVFVDTWENGVEDKKKNAGDFIKSKKYTFNVLLDEKSEVVAAYEVSGIPTKFVIDKEGVIRFKTVGFGGNDDELVKELTLMIGMAGGSAPKLTGAP